ncbi:MAG: AbrB/MazE/SpoVT family DNA-binding domain-containing protein [Bacteroidales bacterium]|nr:AbrB/MazE/SpoVT family DNA-binding domain-containing protein [Bacteroidales bacterium]
MELPVIKVGNSGVEIVEIEDCIELRPSAKPRENWEEAFKQMNRNNDDTLLIDDVFADEISKDCC